MARIPQGILGGLRGRIGNVIGASWKGINYIRSMPLSVANPNTAAQQAQRGSFTSTVLVARLLLADLIATYWDPFARAMSGYNHFISANINAFNTTGLGVPVNFSASRGILTGFADLVVVGEDIANTLVFTWTDNDGDGDALAADEPVMVWHNSTQNYWRFLKPVSQRAAGTITIPELDMVVGDVVDTWAFFGRLDLSKISDSTYNEVTVAA